MERRGLRVLEDDAHWNLRLAIIAWAIWTFAVAVMDGPVIAAISAVIALVTLVPWTYLSWRKGRRRAEGERLGEDFLMGPPMR